MKSSKCVLFFCLEAEFDDFSSESSFSGPGSHFLSATTNTRWLFLSPVVPVTPFPSPEARDRQQSSPSPQVESQTPSEDENSTISKSSSSLGSHRTPDPAGDPQGRLECRSRASEDGNGETGTTGETNNHRILVVALGKCDPGPENDDSDEKSTISASGKKNTHLLDFTYIKKTIAT